MPRHRTTIFVTVLGLLLAGSAVFLGPRPGEAVATIGAGQPESLQVGLSAEPAASQAPRLRELVELRSENSKTFELADGQREWVGYGEAVHYQDANGVFRDIDNSIVSDQKQIEGSAYAYRNGANAFTARFGATADDSRLVKLEYRGASIAFGPAGAAASPARKTADVRSQTLTDLTYGEKLVGYPEVYPGIDLFYELKTYGIKEYLTLRQPTTMNEFTFDVVLEGLTPKEAEGRITFANDQGETLFLLGEPMAVDDAGVETRDVAYTISGKGRTYELTVTISRAYLEDARRAYPVVVDPDMMITGYDETYDSWACTVYPTTNYVNSTYLRTGRDTPYGIRRTFLRFDLSDAQDIDPNDITSAYIRLEKYSGVNPTQVRAYRNTTSWSSGTVTWANAPTFSNSEVSTYATSDGGNWWRMYSTTVVKKWLIGTYNKFGWTIIDDDEAIRNPQDHWTTFYSCDAPSPHKPELHIIFSGGYIVRTTLACDGVFRNAQSDWLTLANGALEAGDNAFVRDFGIDFQIRNTSAWTSPLDGCSSKPYCTSSHSAYSHVDPITMMNDASADLGWTGIDMMVPVTGAGWLKDSQFGDATMYGRAYDYGSNKCIVVYGYPYIPTYAAMRHELSHCYNAYDHDPEGAQINCVMYYRYVSGHVEIPYPTGWCTSCYAGIYAHRSLHS